VSLDQSLESLKQRVTRDVLGAHWATDRILLTRGLQQLDDTDSKRSLRDCGVLENDALALRIRCIAGMMHPVNGRDGFAALSLLPLPWGVRAAQDRVEATRDPE